MINKEVKLIAHRLGFLETNYPENSFESLKYIFENEKLLDSCDGFEFDIVFTKDNIPVIIHDEFIDDVSNGVGKVKKSSLENLKGYDFCSRKSSNGICDHTFKIVTLEEVLKYFKENADKLGSKVIKVETKDILLFQNKNISSLANILSDFPELSNNIIHLSFIPNNLDILRKYQIKKGLTKIKTDLLCDYKFALYLSKLYKHIDSVSIRIKTSYDVDWESVENIRIYLKLLWNYLTISLSNALTNKTIKYALDNFSQLGIYVINEVKDIEMLYKKIDIEILNSNIEQISITTDNPQKLKKIFVKKKEFEK